jgi:hypothetical protein
MRPHPDQGATALASSPEVTAKIREDARRGCGSTKVGVAYYGRSYEEGKKITWKRRGEGDPGHQSASASGD